MRIVGGATFWASWPFLYMYLRNSVRCRVLVVAEGKVLLVQTWHGTGEWSLPGGGIHDGEDPALAATRELKEETDVALGVDQLRLLKREPYRSHGLRFDCHYFLAELGQTINASPNLPEILSSTWVDERELGDYKLSVDAQAALSARSALLQ
jgi:8-oxo-dGTP pyrophosphatase MutT (NUDIX family)